LIQIDYSLLLQIVNFLLLILILNFLLYKPMLAVIDKRKKRLAESEEEIERLNRSAEEKMAAYEEKLQSTKIESLNKNKEIIKEGSEEAMNIINDVNKELSIMADDFHGKLQKDVETARGFLSKQSQALSFEIAEKVMGRKIQ
jgi:F-type H+-transporting ATPase subunit b